MEEHVNDWAGTEKEAVMVSVAIPDISPRGNKIKSIYVYNAKYLVHR